MEHSHLTKEDLDKFESLKLSMTAEIASDVKLLRIDRGFTWRAVCRDISVKYPQLGLRRFPTGSGYQPDGKMVCYAAMEFLGETSDRGWI